MGTQTEWIQAEVSAATRTACRIGFPAAFLLALVTALAFILGITTPIRSGPYCTGLCMTYPYAEAAQFYPRDYVWMGPALLIAPLFMVVAACVHFCVPLRAKPLSLLGVCFSTLATGVLAADYLMQLLVVQGSLLHGELEGIALLTQYNAHGVFLALEDTGYLLMAISFLPICMAIPIDTRRGLWLRATLGTAFGLALIAFGGFAAHFGAEMSLPFELAIILVVWMAVIVAAVQLAVFFKVSERAAF